MFDFEQITYWCADHPSSQGWILARRTRRPVGVANTNLDLLELTATSGRLAGRLVSWRAASPSLVDRPGVRMAAATQIVACRIERFLRRKPGPILWPGALGDGHMRELKSSFR